MRVNEAGQKWLDERSTYLLENDSIEMNHDSMDDSYGYGVILTRLFDLKEDHERISGPHSYTGCIKCGPNPIIIE